jgi:Zn-dependent protease with chaperone function
MNIKARYFDGKTSASQDVEVALLDNGGMRVAGVDPPRTATLANTRISERIGNTPRRLFFADGAICELDDNDALDDWLTRMRGHSLEHRVFRMERMWHVAVPALLATVVIVWFAIQFGVPALAGHAAKVIPTSVDTTIGREGLDLLDKTLFEPSQLPAERQAEIRADFARIVADSPKSNHDYRLEFRRGDRVGANAFALPSGIVVITDELVALAEDPNEITAVLAHEVGHVVHRHALRTIIQGSATAAIMIAITGDFTAVSSIIGAAPTVLLQAKFSRSLEIEADDFSYDWLKKHNIPAHYFGDLLLRMEKEHGGDSEDSFDYFSSHPSPRQRVRN